MVIAGKDVDNGVVEFQFYQPDNRTKWETFQKAIYDKESNQILGRTPKSWGQLLLFYSIFYIVLAALFAICMQGLFATLDDREPRWKLNDSLIGVNPGLGFRPISNKTEEGSLIWYNLANSTTIDKWVDLVNEFLTPYNANQTGKNFIKCNFTQPPGKDQVCETTLSNFGSCNPDRLYGYTTASPCVFIKLNRIINWNPQYFTTPQDGMPPQLRNHINELNKNNTPEHMVWVTCNGVDDLDKENVKDFNYYPKGFASYYYPYRNVDNYLSPIVAVEILDLTPNIVVSIECRAWAQNIEYRGGSLNRAGSVRFEIQVDGKYQTPIIAPQHASLVDAAKNDTDVKTPKNNTTEEAKSTIAPETHKPTDATTALINATAVTGVSA